MKVRFYIAPQKGDGTFENPFRSILNDFINVQIGEWFDEIDHPARRISICCIHAGDLAHANILADSRVFPASPLFNDESEVPHGVEITFDNIPNISAIKTKLEANGISASWVTGSNALRDVLRYLIRNFVICQIATGERIIDFQDFLKTSLDLTIAEVSQAQRVAIRNWMQAKGLAIGWITNQSTVREVLHFIISNLGFGKFRMSGVDF